jgi:hypothetical protein
MKTSIKIAAVTDDGVTISPHFGRARYYEVLTIENGAIAKRERRERAGHGASARQKEPHHHQGEHREDHLREYTLVAGTITWDALTSARLTFRDVSLIFIMSICS